MLNLLVIGAEGCLGAFARYGLSGLVQRQAGAGFPAGALVVTSPAVSSSVRS